VTLEIGWARERELSLVGGLHVGRRIRSILFSFDLLEHFVDGLAQVLCGSEQLAVPDSPDDVTAEDSQFQ
jgi:hypothetical protein